MRVGRRRSYALGIEKIEPALRACRELQSFAKAHRPKSAPRSGADLIALWTVARSDKTFQAILHLCDPASAGGYGEQAGMLARSLFEDMVVAHWAQKFPERAVKQIIEQDTYVALENARILRRYKLLKPGGPVVSVSKHEEERLERHYSRGGWTRKTVPQMVNAIASMWPHKQDRRFLKQMHDIGHRLNNTLTHHSGRSLSRNVTMEDDRIIFHAGRTESHLGEALAMAFWTYTQTLSLVLDGADGEKLSEIYRKHGDVYATVRPISPATESEMADQVGGVGA